MTRKKQSGAQRARAKEARAAAAASDNLYADSNDSSTSAEPSPQLNGFPSSNDFTFDMEANMSDPEKAERRKEEGTAAYKAGAYAKALECYEAAVSLAPDNAAYIFNRAAAYMALKKFARAEEDCQTVVNMQKATPSSKTLARLGKCQLAQGKADFAVSSLDAAVELDGSNSAARADQAKARDVLTSISNVTRDRGRQDWAAMSMGLDQLERKIEEVPLAWRLWRLEALLGRKPPRIEEAASLANTLLRKDPNNPDALFWRGRVLYMQGETDKAVTHWKEALRCDPDYAAAKTAWNLAKQIEAKKEEGNTFFKTGQLEDAIRVYSEALEIDSSNESVAATLLSNRATAKLKLKRYDEALADCDACLYLQAEHVKALRTQGKCYTALERWEDAVGAYKQAFANAPQGSQLERELKADFKSAEGDLKRSKMKDHYKILGCSRDAGEYEIKRAYKKMSLTLHPDKGGSAESFKELSESYAILSDPQRKARYDAGEDENEQPNMSDFSSAFGGGSPFFSFAGGPGASFGGGSPFGGGGGGSPFESMFGGSRGFHSSHHFHNF